MAISQITNKSITDATITADDIASGAVEGAMTTQIGGRRNLIINGAMQVAQRGTSTAITTGGYASLDRFQYALGSSATGRATISQSSDAPSGFGSSYKVEITTADAAPSAAYEYSLKQRIEGQNLQSLKKGTADAQSVTLSFWVKCSITGTFIVELMDNDNSNRHINKSYTVNSADTWEYKTITFSGDTTGALDNDNANSMHLLFWNGSGSNFTGGTLQTSWGALTQTNRAVGQTNLFATVGNTWQITGVQLEVGSVATPFEHRSFGEELQLCSRYFQKSYEYSTVIGATTYIGMNGQTGSLAGATTSYLVDEIKFPVRMRDNATVVSYDTVGNQGKCTRELPGTATYTNENVAVNYPSETGASLMSVSGTNASYIYFHYTADAEL